MIIIGIDPGSRKAGFGVIELQGKKIKYIDSGALIYDTKGDFLNRLGQIYRSCDELIARYKPEQISIESLIYVKNVTSLAKLAQARGAMVAAFMKTHEKRVFEYSPNLVKSTVSGHGHSTKEAIHRSLEFMFGKKLKFKTDDESDALAVAVCHAINKDVLTPESKDYRSTRRSFKNSFKHLE